MELNEIVAIILWFGSGAMSYAWSMDWQVEKKQIPLLLGISCFGLLAIPEAVRIKKYMGD